MSLIMVYIVTLRLFTHSTYSLDSSPILIRLTINNESLQENSLLVYHARRLLPGVTYLALLPIRVSVLSHNSLISFTHNLNRTSFAITFAERVFTIIIILPLKLKHKAIKSILIQSVTSTVFCFKRFKMKLQCRMIHSIMHG